MYLTHFQNRFRSILARLKEIKTQLRNPIKLCSARSNLFLLSPLSGPLFISIPSSGYLSKPSLEEAYSTQALGLVDSSRVRCLNRVDHIWEQILPISLTQVHSIHNFCCQQSPEARRPATHVNGQWTGATSHRRTTL